jgi:hypothetical protein
VDAVAVLAERFDQVRRGQRPQSPAGRLRIATIECGHHGGAEVGVRQQAEASEEAALVGGERRVGGRHGRDEGAVVRTVDGQPFEQAIAGQAGDDVGDALVAPDQDVGRRDAQGQRQAAAAAGEVRGGGGFGPHPVGAQFVDEQVPAIARGQGRYRETGGAVAGHELVEAAAAGDDGDGGAAGQQRAYLVGAAGTVEQQQDPASV